MRVLAALALALVLGGALGPATRAAEAPPAAPALAAQAYEDAQMATASRAAAALAQSAARLAAGDPELAALVRKRQDAESRWRALDGRRLAALAQPGDAARAKAAELAALQKDTADEIAGADRTLAERYPDFADLVSPAPLSLAATQALLKPGEALVFIVPTDAGTYIWAVRRDAAAWKRSGLNRSRLAALVRSLRSSLDPAGAARAAADASGQAERAPKGFPRREAFGLYQEIWAPVADTVGDASTVYVVATGDLSALPLAVLPTAAPEGDDLDPAALRETPWLFERHALATLPSVASLKAIRRAGAAHEAGGPAFAGFGDPVLAGPGAGAPRGFEAYYAGGRADIGQVKSLPSLPGTRGELYALAKALKAPRASVVSGAAATETAVKQADLSHTRVIAFATHGLLAGDLDGLGEPALVFTPPETASALDDGLLTASEAAGLRLSADWVVLSACNTAAPDGRGGFEAGGEGLSGLARGFFHAGARSLLVSHWRVRDDAAARLTTGAIRWYARDPRLGRAGALQRAMREMLFDRRHPEFAQPSYWAPFVVAGEAG